MTKSIKVINCSISLNTKNNAEEYAAAVLRDWYKRNSANQTKSQFSVYLNDFHKDIYLSGLFVYLLSPRLCKGLCNTLGYDSVNTKTLEHVFASCGISLNLPTKAEETEKTSLEQYIKNIELLMKTELVGLSSSMDQLMTQTTTISNQQREISSYVKENNQLNLEAVVNLIKNLESNVQALANASPKTAVPDGSSTDISAISLTLKQIQSQISSLHNVIANGINTNEINSKPADFVDDSLQKAKKIKSKKIW